MCQNADDPEHRRALELWEQGYERQLADELAGAERLYRESIALHPTAEAWTFLGWLASFRGELDAAIECCHRAIATDPDFGNPYNDIGAYLIERGEYEVAIPWLERATRAPRYAALAFPWTNLGRACERMGRFKEAVAHYRKALEIAPRYAPAIEALERLVARRNGHVTA